MSSKTLVKPILGRAGNHLASGIVGLANVGKSTFFQAITKSKMGNPANYPFATIKPEEAVVTVQSSTLDKLAALYGSQKIIPSVLNIWDIAGLIKGASENKGLGNAFLSDIRAVDGIFQVVRGFKDDDITHIEGNVDPTRDLTIVQDELLLKDMEFIENSLDRIAKNLKNKRIRPAGEVAKLEVQQKTLAVAYDHLLEGRRILDKPDWTEEEIEALNEHSLLTAKPAIFLLNVSKQDYLSGENEFLSSVQCWVDENAPGSAVMMFSADYESQIVESGENSAIPKIVNAMRDALKLISFYTCGPIEARQWTIRQGTLCPQASGVIHSDFERTFINAEVIKFRDIANMQPPLNEKSLRSLGKIARVGKTYVVEDGDLMRINAAAAKR
ncbi:hypothetical protein OGAPHI_007321 [Ogataea philodendri]|uniref:Obg-like ATPase homolog n=1 Tax=Ogataea philodendri TaxID=1378263 RepID=A0A9P8NVS3_9ASCO|nr:uncharacterized protein OGAPHI_007321 [Ogataea philodendri]KAH3660116.1 hypothetical protein OGAPHI_007321 [Ogataea philodendri]